jgi:hypothetical protein
VIIRIFLYLLIAATFLWAGIQIGKQIERPARTWTLPAHQNFNAGSHERRF